MKLEFFYDIVCPYAYIASIRLSTLRVKVGESDVAFTPVLLGGIYDQTKAPQGKAGSATDAQPRQKSVILKQDFERTLATHKIPLVWNKNHPVRTLDALRALTSVTNQSDRKRLTHALFKAYWVNGLDVSQKAVILNVAKSVNVALKEECWNDKQVSTALHEATTRVVELGAPGVPFFYLPQTISGEPACYWGGDRLVFVESHLRSLQFKETNPSSTSLPPPFPQLRLAPSSSFPLKKERNLIFFWDFSSPWSYLGFNVVKDRLQPLCGPNLKITHVPIVIGGIFNELGSGNILSLPPQKQRYGGKDMQDWIHHWNALPLEHTSQPPHPTTLLWPDRFPIRSVTASRVAILYPETTTCLFDASWRFNEDVSDANGVEHVLVEEGYGDDEAADMVAKATSDSAVKQALWENMAWAKRCGVFGVPSFVVCEFGVVWGQDRVMDVVADLLAGVKVVDGKKGASRL
ncbi:thioredoxin-like protein [Rhizoclosmatium globosum]|uniref:Thioredoxin-like protein n=1 Tax=Rhizoclosmatium globosum TaxID=329046 RepID=A0A1Y2BR94_9FUNG|nr:thioredoxin-like protein [Rhizoclosmatium globosum]|eukprot:ORY37269.1 thioredoxin-like protein [Rhizoclosmatium globosum]